MKRASDDSTYSKSSSNSSPSSYSPQSTGTSSQNAVPPTVSTPFNFHMDTETPGWFSLAASSRTAGTTVTASQPHLSVRNADQDGWSDNASDSDDETGAPASSAGVVGTATEPDFLTNAKSGEKAEAEQGVTPGMHAEDGYEDTDFNQHYTALLAAAGDGDVTAQYKIALMYASGIVDDRGLEDAEPWLRRAAEQGHAKAQELLEKHFS